MEGLLQLLLLVVFNGTYVVGADHSEQPKYGPVLLSHRYLLLQERHVDINPLLRKLFLLRVGDKDFLAQEFHGFSRHLFLSLFGVELLVFRITWFLLYLMVFESKIVVIPILIREQLHPLDLLHLRQFLFVFERFYEGWQILFLVASVLLRWLNF